MGSMKPVEGIRDPWDRVQALAEQCLRLSTADAPYVPSKVPDFLGWLLARLSNSYYGQESVFFSKAVERFTQAAENVYKREVSREEVYRLTCYPNKKMLREGARQGSLNRQSKPLEGFEIFVFLKKRCRRRRSGLWSEGR